MFGMTSAQNRDQLRQQAEEQLKKLTPEEVEAKLKELEDFLAKEEV